MSRRNPFKLPGVDKDDALDQTMTSTTFGTLPSDRALLPSHLEAKPAPMQAPKVPKPGNFAKLRRSLKMK